MPGSFLDFESLLALLSNSDQGPFFSCCSKRVDIVFSTSRGYVNWVDFYSRVLFNMTISATPYGFLFTPRYCSRYQFRSLPRSCSGFPFSFVLAKSPPFGDKIIITYRFASRTARRHLLHKSSSGTANYSSYSTSYVASVAASSISSVKTMPLCSLHRSSLSPTRW